jgi:predicted DNA repair protein MutK
MPLFLKILSTVGMVAMLWVGGHIVIHGAYELGLKAPEQWVQEVTTLARAAAPMSPGFVAWVVRVAIDAVVGLAVGALVAPLAGKVLGPTLGKLKSLWPGSGA